MIRTSIAALTCLFVLGGCSENAEQMYPVTGTVTLDGKPLPDGNIQFVPLDGKHGAEPGIIKDGRYELAAIEGQKRVEISASKIILGSSLRGAGGEPVPEEYLPERYNASSELTADVKPQENVIDFPLVNKK
jgi:hypothetical protein